MGQSIQGLTILGRPIEQRPKRPNRVRILSVPSEKAGHLNTGIAIAGPGCEHAAVSRDGRPKIF